MAQKAKTSKKPEAKNAAKPQPAQNKDKKHWTSLSNSSRILTHKYLFRYVPEMWIF